MLIWIHMHILKILMTWLNIICLDIYLLWGIYISVKVIFHKKHIYHPTIPFPPYFLVKKKKPLV
jgi:hypothetical protein